MTPGLSRKTPFHVYHLKFTYRYVIRVNSNSNRNIKIKLKIKTKCKVKTYFNAYTRLKDQVHALNIIYLIKTETLKTSTKSKFLLIANA